MGMTANTGTKNGLILVMGDSLADPTLVIDELDPVAFGFLCFTNLGIVNATELTKKRNIDLSCCVFEHIHGLVNRHDFFAKCSSITDFLRNHCNVNQSCFCTDENNIEALLLTAIAANKAQTTLQVLLETSVLKLDSSENALLDLLSAIVKEFNLSRYKESLNDISFLNERIRTSKGKNYCALLTKLALGYFEWDCRRYADARESLIGTVQILDNTKEDFSQIYDDFRAKIGRNILFLNRLIADQVTLGAIDAFFNGSRRYDAGDDLICILSLANCVEFCFRGRLKAMGVNPDDQHRINRYLKKKLGDGARNFFISKGLFHLDGLCPTAEEPSKAYVTPGFSFKPGFVDLLQILELIDGDFYKEISGVIDAEENEGYLGILQLNTLRNSIVHKMGATLDKELPKALTLSEYIIEIYLKRLVGDSSDKFPELKEDTIESLITQSNNYVDHLRLNLYDMTRGFFS